MRRTLLAPVLLTVAVAFVAGGILLVRRDEAGGSDRLVVRDAWSAPNQAVTAVYLTIDNGAGGDRLVGASTDRAGTASLMGDNTAEVSHAASGETVDLAVPRGTTELHPGGGHLMLQDLSAPLEPGDRFRLELEFERSGPVTVTVEVLTWNEATARSH